ncbi:tryptophan synthase beta chain [Tepiditoga spiralis]|uniref:Tryptophan synthase beta chain n=1 Tax=Tepiditoga spiralis TaxID=2108365 RepID=A0A7G1G6N7_9BACT|nr:tryptophan synthase subunit beta [Tepiditoga spiralis]BBE31016.1 tryptophan synthase beta chain [Tepiditoga spiralis]
MEKIEYYGVYGGTYIPEVLKSSIDELKENFYRYAEDKKFNEEYKNLLKTFVGRPTPLYYAENLTKKIGGAKIFFKLEGLANTGAHKINNSLGQALLAKKIGKKRIIAETGAGQHGVATAAVCAKLNLECEIFMGEVDIKRQRPNVFIMEQFGAKIHSVTNGTKTLKDAVNEALRYWTKRSFDTHYLIGSALGPAPYPQMVKFFQSIIGKEVKEQLRSENINKPDYMIACVGGGSNAIGFFSEYINDESVKLIGVEAGGKGIESNEHASKISGNGTVGIVQGYKSKFLQNNDGQILSTHSISAGLDYAGIGPELVYLNEIKRINFVNEKDDEVIKTFNFVTKNEGIVPALESTHAISYALKLASNLNKNKNIIVNISGIGNKDIFITAKLLDKTNWINFLKREVEENG